MKRCGDRGRSTGALLSAIVALPSRLRSSRRLLISVRLRGPESPPRPAALPGPHPGSVPNECPSLRQSVVIGSRADCTFVYGEYGAETSGGQSVFCIAFLRS